MGEFCYLQKVGVRTSKGVTLQIVGLEDSANRLEELCSMTPGIRPIKYYLFRLVNHAHFLMYFHILM